MKERAATTGYRQADQSKLRQNLEQAPPHIKAVMNLMTRNESDTSRNQRDREHAINPSKLKKISDVIANNINAATDLRQITPYIAKAELIWKTLLLYPNGPQRDLLTYDTNDSVFKNTKLHSELIKAFKMYYTSDYKIEEELPDIVGELIARSGAYIKLSLSRPALDHLINGEQRAGTEAMTEIRAEVGREFVRTDNGFRARNKGLVRDPRAEKKIVHGLESLFQEPHDIDHGAEFDLIDPAFNISLTDNPSVLALKEIHAGMSRRIVESVTGIESLRSRIEKRKLRDDSTIQTQQTGANKSKADKGAPSAVNTDVLTDGQLEAMQQSMYKHRNYVTRNVATVKLSDAYNIKPFGIPLRFSVPTEAFVPIHINGDPKKHAGGFILLDDNGEFLKSTRDATFYQGSRKQNDKIDTPNQQGSTNDLISKLKTVQDGKDCNFDMSEFARLSADQLEKMLIQSIASSTGGKSVTVSLEQEVVKIWLSRAFAGQRVKVLYVPAESFTYFAFNYSNLGLGTSLTNLAKMFIARLATLDVADTLAALDQAQTVNEMSIRVETEDLDPESTIEQARGSWFGVNPTLHSIISASSLSVPDIVEGLRQASLRIKLEQSDNPFLPTPEINVTQVDRTGYRTPDDSSRQAALNSISNTFLLKRSWLDDKEEGNDFQVEALAEQEMLRNQTVLWSYELCRFIIDHLRKDAMMNEVLLNRLIDIISENKALQLPDTREVIKNEEGKPYDDDILVEVILADFLNNLYVTLPKAATLGTTNQLKEKIAAVNELVMAWIEMSGGMGMMKDAIESTGIDTTEMSPERITSLIKGVYLIDLYQQYNLPMPFDNVANKGKEGGMYSLINEVDQYSENIGLFVTTFGKMWVDRAEKIKAKLQKILPDASGDNFGGGDEEQDDGTVVEDVKITEEGGEGNSIVDEIDSNTQAKEKDGDEYNFTQELPPEEE